MEHTEDCIVGHFLDTAQYSNICYSI